MGAPIFIDSIVLPLGRFLRNREQERNVPEVRVEDRARDHKASPHPHITLSNGQMLLPEIGAPYEFLK